VALCVLALIGWAGSGEPPARLGRGAAVIAYVLALAISVPGSDHPARSAIEVTRVISIFCLFLAAGQLAPDRLSLALRLLFAVFSALVLGSVAVAALRRPEAYLGGLAGPASGAIRLMGLARHPTTLGYAAMMAACGLLSQRHIGRSRALTLSLTALWVAAIIYCLYRSDARTGVIAVALVVGLALATPWLERTCASGPPRRRLKALATVAALTVFLAPVAVGFLTPQPAVQATDTPGKFRVGSIDERMRLWREMPAAFLSRPIAGTGFGVSRAVVPAWDAKLKRHHWKAMAFYHSLLVNCLATSGLIGFSAGLWLLISGVWAAIDRLGEQNLVGRERHTVSNVRAAVLMLAGSYPFAALDGALQGDYESLVVWFVALAVLFAPGQPHATWSEVSDTREANAAA
jgi:hypothetical protein